MSVTPYRQPIVPHDRGMDVLATHRALYVMGHKDVNRTSNKAGPDWEHAVRSVQHNHGLRVDGIYGRATHNIAAQHFDKYSVWLYTHAKIRHRSDGYKNPFAATRSLVVGRCDEGVDYFGYGPIHAIGDCVITGHGGSGWPGGQFLTYRLTNGRHAGKYVYIAEGISVAVSVGQHVKAGAAVCSFRYDAAPGHYPGIEFGWGSSIVNLTYAAVSHQLTPPPYNNTPPGMAFARFLHAVGAPAPSVPPGPEFV